MKKKLPERIMGFKSIFCGSLLSTPLDISLRGTTEGWLAILELLQGHFSK